MSNDRFLFRLKNDLSTIINQPLQTSNRIKFTCFDVSSRHLVFGATSGGIYIYNRKPCNFMKLLPSKEGAITNLSISDDDKIAVSTVKGLILILLQPFSNHNNSEFLVFTEHENNNVTTMKWHKNLLYTGDHIGNVAVIDLSTTFVSKTAWCPDKQKKSIFKVPCAALMKLDSSIVQFDTYSNYLLISTETKTFLCDTNEEHYKQIGKKLRNGLFGCSFLNRSNSDTNVEDVKIISARPGCRLWEANFTCEVIRTHQFKETLVESKSTYIDISEDDTDVQINSKSNNLLLDFENFKLLHVIDNKYLSTYNSNGIYVFDMEFITVSSWTCDVECDKKIKDVKIFGNYIYIWMENSDVILLYFSTLSNILKRALSKKQFNICSKICLHFKEHLLQLLEDNEELHLLHLMKDYLEEKQERETLKELNFLFEKLDIKAKTWVLGKGIHVLKNLSSIETNMENIPKESANSTNEVVADESTDPFSDVNYNLNILYKNYKSSCIDLRKTQNVFANKSLPEIVDLLQQFIGNVIKTDETKFVIPPQYWCYNQFLYHLQETQQNFVEYSDIHSYIIEAFVTSNKSSDVLCPTCSFPLPNVRKVPKYHNIGCEIVNLISSQEDALSNFLINVPYMWKDLLITKDYYNDLLLPIIIQFSDEDVLKNFASRFTYDNWDSAIKHLIKLKNKFCLNCDKTIDFDDGNTFNWTKFCITMSEHIGGISSIKLLTTYSDQIDSNGIGMEFYQTCIFNTIVSNYSGGLLKESTVFMKKMHNDRNSANEVSNLLNKYLTKKHLMPNNEEESRHNVNKLIKDNNCTFCNMPLSVPVLKDVFDISCGHPYHKDIFCIMV